MSEIITYLCGNKEWLFSGAGLVGIAWLFRIIFNKRQAASSQTIQAGNESTNVQGGRDVHINIDKQVKKK